MPRAPRRAILLLIPLLCLSAPGCYRPPVNDDIRVTFQPDGSYLVEVVSTFKQGDDLTWEDRDAIQRAVDLYLLGRDPWLRGLERGEASGIRHEMEGDERSPGKLYRSGVVTTIEALQRVMPDATANFSLDGGGADGPVTLRVMPIDVPEPLRENRQRIEREVGAFAVAGFDYVSRQCDVYDYLAERADRRRNLLGALAGGGPDVGTLTPRETVLAERFNEALARIFDLAYPGGEPVEEPLAITRIPFSGLGEGFCVQLETQAVETLGFVERKGEGDGNLWCLEVRSVDDLIETMMVQADPDLETLSKVGEEELAGLMVSCRRPDDEQALERQLWDVILPRPVYELSWRRVTPASS